MPRNAGTGSNHVTLQTNMDIPNHTPDNASENEKWKRTYRMVFLTGVGFVLALGLFTWLFNNPI